MGSSTVLWKLLCCDRQNKAKWQGPVLRWPEPPLLRQGVCWGLGSQSGSDCLSQAWVACVEIATSRIVVGWMCVCLAYRFHYHLLGFREVLTFHWFPTSLEVSLEYRVIFHLILCF